MTHSALTDTIKLSPQYSSRDETRIDTFLIHHTASVSGRGDGVVSMMVNRTRTVSSNYVIGNDGHLWCVVDEDFRAWTSGSATDGGKGAAWDRRAITVEIVNEAGAPDWPISVAAIDKAARLLNDLRKRYGIAHILGHRDLWATYQASYPTFCPGPNTVARIVARAAELAGNDIDYRRLATYLNRQSLGVTSTTGDTSAGRGDGIPGPNYYTMVQTWGKRNRPDLYGSGYVIDGIPGPGTFRVEAAIWALLNKPEPAPVVIPEPEPAPVIDLEPEQPAEEQEAPVSPTPDPVDDIVSQPIPDAPEGEPEPDPQHAARREALVRRIFTAIADVIRGRRTVGELAIATLRTVVPFVYSWVIVWATTNVSWLDWLAYVPADIALEAQSAAVIALGTGIYALLRKLAQRWPNLERFLGSAKTPTYTG
ncbi:N-acetylmuramoyl-L-alanine amidase [Microcella pacifica]|uniref:N-acetylmuramoyl-L-alanine amidase n=1 Tax=Microcella pacifica TaxID=2591847 RepID=A0A9E5JNL2_9MICO|nr:N-acetylmuramoyl-L-alanine amidase [Microcella pacifica]NHF62226.1 hypothetical protein [Microcella pacifica]